MSSFIDYAELKTRVSMQDALSKLSLTLKPVGNQARGFCPKCQAGGDRALVVTPEKSLFYCFNAKTGGDQIALVAHVLGLKTNEAANWLAGTVPLARNNKTISPTVPPASGPKKAGGFDPEAYAAKLDPAHASLAPLSLSPEILKDFAAGYASSGVNRGRLAIGLKDRDGKLVAFAGQALTDESPKMLYPRDFDITQLVFGVDRITQSEVRLVADPLEVIRAAMYGEETICFLTDVVTAAQHELLAVHQHEKKFDVFYPSSS